MVDWGFWVGVGLCGLGGMEGLGYGWGRAQKDPRTSRGSLVSGGECWLDVVPDEMWESEGIFGAWFSRA